MEEQINKDEDMLSIYISFDRLKAADVAFYLQRFSAMADKLIEDYFVAEGKPFSAGQIPRLEIESVHTGNSIDFKLKEGKQLKVESDKEHDFVIRAPKRYGIPLLIASLLFNAYTTVLDIIIKHVELQKDKIEVAQSRANDSLDHETKVKDLAIKDLELKIKQREYAKILRDENNEIDTRKIYESNPELRILAQDTIKEIAKNEDFKDFRINGISIKTNKPNEEDTASGQ